MAAAPEPRRRRRRKSGATGHLRVIWRAKGPMWLMKYRLPDGTESMRTLGAAWVNKVRRSARLAAHERQATGGQAQRGCGARRAAGVPGSADRADTAGADRVRALRRRLPRALSREGAFPDDAGDVRAVRRRGQGAMARLAGRRRRRRRTRGLSRRAGRARPRREHAQPASCRAVGHLQGRAARFRVTSTRSTASSAPRSATPATSRSTASKRSGRSSARPAPAFTTPASARIRARPRPASGCGPRAAVHR